MKGRMGEVLKVPLLLREVFDNNAEHIVKISELLF